MPSASHRARLLASLVLILATLGLVSHGNASVSVAPSRIVLEGRTFAATIYLTNRGDETRTYRIGLAKLRMLESGRIVPVGDDEPTEELFANDLIRFSPRRCVIPPGGSQTIRLLVRRPRGDRPQNAEYRTHLSMRTIPDTPELGEISNEAEPAADSDQMSVRAVATVETLVPVIIRFGRLEAEPGIEGVDVALGPEPEVSLRLTRRGSRSLYGDLHFVHVDDRGEESDLGVVRGVAVYTPLRQREVRFPLTVPPGVDLSDGSLRVEYQETEEGGGNGHASASVPLTRSGTD